MLTVIMLDTEGFFVILLLLAKGGYIPLLLAKQLLRDY